MERGGEKAEVVLREGRVVDAAFGLAGAEKALWRLLTQHEGQFVFAPGEPPGPDRIERRLDDLILEGLRQADELARLLPALPAPDEAVELAVGPEEIPVDLHPVTAEVVANLAAPCRVGELIDRCAASDLEAARALLALLDHGYARLAAELPAAPEPSALLAPHELHALRTRVARGRASGARTIGKVVVTGGGPLSRQAALARFAALPGYEVMPEEAEHFGTLGRLALGEGVRVDLVELPGDPRAAAALAPLRRRRGRGAGAAPHRGRRAARRADAGAAGAGGGLRAGRGRAAGAAARRVGGRGRSAAATRPRRCGRCWRAPGRGPPPTDRGGRRASWPGSRPGGDRSGRCARRARPSPGCRT